MVETHSANKTGKTKRSGSEAGPNLEKENVLGRR